MVREHSFLFTLSKFCWWSECIFILLLFQFSFQTNERIRRPKNQFGVALGTSFFICNALRLLSFVNDCCCCCICFLSYTFFSGGCEGTSFLTLNLDGAFLFEVSYSAHDWMPIVGISEPFDNPPCLNYKVSFFHSWNYNNISSPKKLCFGGTWRNIWTEYMRIDSWIADDFVNTSLESCVDNTGKNQCSEVFEDKLQFLWKSHWAVRRSKIFMGTAKTNYITESAIETL